MIKPLAMSTWSRLRRRGAGPAVGAEHPWPFARSSAEELRERGFSDAELTVLANDTSGASPVPSLSWTTEAYGIGACMRRWLGWPRGMWLPATIDHGVAFSGMLGRDEREFEGRLHLVWSANRARVLRTLSAKTIVHVPHPWITHRHRTRPLPSPDRAGTLVFFPHTTADVSYDAGFARSYLDQLTQLGQRFRPLVVMLHPNDVRPELLSLLREAGLPVVSAGLMWSAAFVDRFYDLVDLFEYATSSSGGSELFYCHEFGLKYFLHGDPPRYFNSGDPNLPLGERQPLDVLERKNFLLKRKYFSSLEDQEGKDDFVIDLLGLDSAPDVGALRRGLALEALRLWNVDGKGSRRVRFLLKSLLEGGAE